MFLILAGVMNVKNAFLLPLPSVEKYFAHAQYFRKLL